MMYCYCHTVVKSAETEVELCKKKDKTNSHHSDQVFINQEFLVSDDFKKRCVNIES